MDAQLLQLQIGQVLARDYRVVRPLAAGGMGSVYLVEQLSTGKMRALKIMHPQYARDEESRGRFAQEARAGARIKSEHVVEVVAAGVDDETGIPWLAMELLDGEELSSRMRRAGRLPWGEVREIFRQLSHGLGEAHRQGLVHRDLKPENIFIAVARSLSAPFTLKVLDFGVAKLAQESQTQTDGTRPVGTPRWMAPEQSEERAHITPATDVWAMGLLAFHLLTGRFYWRAANSGGSLTTLLRELVLDPIEPPSMRAAALNLADELPPAFDGWFARCVVRDASQRFPDADAAMRALLPLFDRAPAWDVSAIPVLGRAREPELVPDAGDSATLAPDPAGKTMAEKSGATLPPAAAVTKRARPSSTPALKAQPLAPISATPAASSTAAEPPGSQRPLPFPVHILRDQGKVLLVILILVAAAVAAFALRPRKPKPWPPNQLVSTPVQTAATAADPAAAPPPPAEPDTFLFALNSDPSDAEVFEGETKIGTTPLEMKLENAPLHEGPRHFRIVKPGYLVKTVSQGPGRGVVSVGETLEPDPQAPAKAAPKKHREAAPAADPDTPELRLRR